MLTTKEKTFCRLMNICATLYCMNVEQCLQCLLQPWPEDVVRHNSRVAHRLTHFGSWILGDISVGNLLPTD
jgi:hypothetical protein